MNNLQAYGWQRLVSNLMFYDSIFLKELKRIWENFNRNSLPLVLIFKTQFPENSTGVINSQYSFKLNRPLCDVDHIYTYICMHIYTYICMYISAYLIQTFI
jgi:hypothetical protein